ncbi:hypothetical protein PVAND_011173 [Polypedilum vanderplanki]|uniref:Uncharacterized protein n=1 Tax=Polypedilum vanderplanki TaxID=319348 RepID=A0A9J6CIB3_POLVA|nr:hypothetical protein PVAND_011173 [Polypedilum vanderplanki]
MSKRKSLHNKEVFHRINFLHQASSLMANKNQKLSSFYGNILNQVQKKAVVKIDPTIKRDMCKRCSTFLTPQTAEVIPENDTSVLIECKQCGFKKRYLINDYYKLWCEKDSAILETIEVSTP